MGQQPLGWTSERLRLVPLEPDRHLEATYRWINDPQVAQFLPDGEFGFTRPRQQSWFDDNSRTAAKGQAPVVFAVELLDGTHIGDSGIFKLDKANGYANTATLLGPEFQNKGYGTEATKLRAWYCFHVLGLRLLESGYYEGNHGSRKMQENAGYVEAVRTPKRFWCRGQFVDGVRTVLTRERWQELSGGKPAW